MSPIATDRFEFKLVSPKDFTSDAPGRVVKNLQGDFAFVPSPLPGQLVWNNAIVNAISEAEQALGRLAGVGLKLPNPKRLIRMFLRREAELSSRIEQTYARVQTMLLFEHMPNIVSEVPAVQEVENNFRVLEFAFESVSQSPISSTLICRMHELLFESLANDHLTSGAFRDKQNWIGRSNRIDEARYVPPPPSEVKPCMQALVEYMRKKDNLPTLVRCAMIHYQFEAIHPFEDGNGRVGRALVLLMLNTEHALPVPLLNPSAQLERRRHDYYDLLLDVTQRGAWGQWLEFFCQCVASEAKDACERLMKLESMRDGYRARFTSARTSALLMRLIDELLGNPAITARHAADLLKINPANAQRLVDKLTRANILREVTGQRRNRVYVAQEVVDLFATDQVRDH